MWREIFGEWSKAFQQRKWWWWIIPILLYKLFENWILTFLQSLIQANSGWFITMIGNILDNYSWIILWLPIVITVVVLLALTYRDYKKLRSSNAVESPNVGTPTIIQHPPIAKLQVSSQNTIEFYRTRAELIASKEHGTLIEELKDAKTVWVAWWTGINATDNMIYNSININRQPPIDRMILIEPHGDYITSFTRIAGKSIEKIRQEIQDTYNEFDKVGTAVGFLDAPIEGMVIVDKKQEVKSNNFSGDAWIRVEATIPYKDYDNCPNFIVHNNKDSTLFKALLDHYLRLWNEATKPSLRLDFQDSILKLYIFNRHIEPMTRCFGELTSCKVVIHLPKKHKELIEDCNIILNGFPKSGHLFSWHESTTAFTQIGKRDYDYLQLVQIKDNIQGFFYSRIGGWEFIPIINKIFQWQIELNYEVLNDLKEVEVKKLPLNIRFEIQDDGKLGKYQIIQQ